MLWAGSAARAGGGRSRRARWLGRGGDRAVADDRLAVHQHRGLARRGGVEGLVEPQLERLVAARRGGTERRRERRRVVTEADVVDPAAVAVEDRVANLDPPRFDVLAGADRDRVGGGVGGDDVPRLVQRDTDPAALADGEVVVAAVAAELAAGAVDDGALAVDQVAVTAEEALLALTCEEAEVLRLGLLRDRQPVPRGDGPDLVLGHLGEREPEPPEQFRRQRREHVALVLG